MISIGRGIRWYNDYQREAAFSRENGFDFMQVWYRGGDILIEGDAASRLQQIERAGFPILFHAVFDPEDIIQYGERLLDTAGYLGHREVIVHPVSKKTPVTVQTEDRLIEAALYFSERARAKGIIWYLENNSVIDGFHCRPAEVRRLFERDHFVGQLLDVAHVDSYEHLRQLVDIRFPKCLHAAGKHFSVPHEHLPLTEGDIDYGLVFQEYLPAYNGNVILEVDGTDEEILASKNVLEQAINRNN